MKNLSWPIAVLFAVFFVSCGNENVANQQVECKQDTIITRTTVYRPGDYDSRNYRIPAIITAADGSLVIATDKRKCNQNDLPEDIDILINRSVDGGRTWSEPYVLAQGTGYGQGYGDCALVRTNDDCGLMAAFTGGIGLWGSTPENPNRSYIARSLDNGQTWSDMTDVTDLIFGANCVSDARKSWRASFFASGNGLLTSFGRIMFAVAVRETEDYTLNNYVFYSDDNGATWNLSGRASVGGDEAKLVELSDGRILMSIRHETNRWYNISEDGGVTWQTETSVWTDIEAPACDGDIIRYVSSDGRQNCLLQSLPHGGSRENVSVFVSFDEGRTWPVRKCVVPYSSAYSSLCVLPDGSIGMYVEESDGDTLGYSMVYYNFAFDWLVKGFGAIRDSVDF
ncbi:MAG: exo-alpha-sialidase [Bacteroidales bacterium]|nr:exo-alpha-sialidase [Bacteroidales bacterium]